MTVLRGLVGVLVGLAVSVGFVQFMELMLANAIAGRPLQSMEDYAVVLNALPVLGIRLVVTSFLALLGGYLCAKLAEAEEMRYTLIAAIFRILRCRWKRRGLHATDARVGTRGAVDRIHWSDARRRRHPRGSGGGAKGYEQGGESLLRLAYQGEPGAYSEAAALLYGGPQVETMPCKTFDEVFEVVVKKRATHGVVPLENSIGGTIHRNYDLLLEHEIMITARWNSTSSTVCRRCRAQRFRT
jgi:hypothetical protein